MSSLDAYLEPPEPDESVVCDCCQYLDCVCDLPHDLDQERDDFQI